MEQRQGHAATSGAKVGGGRVGFKVSFPGTYQERSWIESRAGGQLRIILSVLIL